MGQHMGFWVGGAWGVWAEWGARSRGAGAGLGSSLANSVHNSFEKERALWGGGGSWSWLGVTPLPWQGQTGCWDLGCSKGFHPLLRRMASSTHRNPTLTRCTNSGTAAAALWERTHPQCSHQGTCRDSCCVGCHARKISSI